MPEVVGWVALAAPSEPSHDGPIARAVLLHQIGEEAAALADDLEWAAARLVVLGEAPKMRRQLLDPLGDERDLDLWRTGVTFLGGEPGHDLLLLFPRERHSFLRTRRCVMCFHFFDRRMIGAGDRIGQTVGMARGRSDGRRREAIGPLPSVPCHSSTGSTPGPATRG